MVHLAEHVLTVNIRAVQRNADRIQFFLLTVRKYKRKIGHVQIGRKKYYRAFFCVIDFLRNFQCGGGFPAAGSTANGNHLTHCCHLPQRKRLDFE